MTSRGYLDCKHAHLQLHLHLASNVWIIRMTIISHYTLDIIQIISLGYFYYSNLICLVKCRNSCSSGFIFVSLQCDRERLHFVLAVMSWRWLSVLPDYKHFMPRGEKCMLIWQITKMAPENSSLHCFLYWLRFNTAVVLHSFVRQSLIALIS